MHAWMEAHENVLGFKIWTYINPAVLQPKILLSIEPMEIPTNVVNTFRLKNRHITTRINLVCTSQFYND